MCHYLGQCSIEPLPGRMNKWKSISRVSLRLAHQRNLANLRERKRMMLINRAFQVLKDKLPLYQLISDHQELKNYNNSRLTKVDILKLTIVYIKQLTRTLNGVSGVDSQEEQLKDIQEYQLKRISNNHSQHKTRHRNKPTSRESHRESQEKSQNRELVVCWRDADNSNVSRYILSWHRDLSHIKLARSDLKDTTIWIPETS